MNELMITISGDQWMYYRTDLTAAGIYGKLRCGGHQH